MKRWILELIIILISYIAISLSVYYFGLEQTVMVALAVIYSKVMGGEIMRGE